MRLLLADIKFIILFPLLNTCFLIANGQAKTNIGSIEYDSLKDDRNFKICHFYEQSLPQYYEVGTVYEGGLKSIKKHFSEKFIPDNSDSTLNGYLTIRFVVNCEGQTGWYRFLETTLEYNYYEFNPVFKLKLLAITKTLDQWKPGLYNNKPCDSYKFLTFKILKGNIADILP